VLEGYAKLSRGADGFIAILHAMGVPFADLLGLATIIVEIVGGLLILAGAFAPVAAVAMIVVLLVAIFTVHLPNGCSSIKLTSYDEAARTSARPLCVAGAGAPSVDGYLKARREARLAEGPAILDGTTSRTRTRHTVASVGPQDLTPLAKKHDIM
jgi:putative oxidoreductase